MKKFYSPTTGGLYYEEIHGKEGIPKDKVEVDDDFVPDHMGMMFVQDSEGKPRLVDAPPTPTKELLAKAQRSKLLSECDWTQLPDARKSLGNTKANEWDEYRKLLRDITNQPNFPTEIAWPKRP